MTLHLKKYQRWLLAILSGLLMGMAWPINGFTGLIFIAWTPLLLIDAYLRQHKTQFSNGTIVLYSYVTFLIFNLYTTWWVSNSTLVGGILAFLLNSFFMALVFGLSHWVDRKLIGNISGFYTLIFMWVSFEFLHMNWELTWSWLNMGNVFSERPNWVQWYEYTGSLGGSIWVLVVNILLFHALIRLIGQPRNYRSALSFALFALLFIALPISLSYAILPRVETQSDKHIDVMCIQPNIEPYNEAYELSSDALISNVLQIVRENMDSTVDLIISPESTIEQSMWEETLPTYTAIDSLQQFINQHPKIQFLVGISTRRFLSPNEVREPHARPFYGDSSLFYYGYNAALFFTHKTPIHIYHKGKLVPGVERMPFKRFLKFIDKFAIDLGGTTGSLGVSKSPERFDIGQGQVVLPIICYESIYGEFVGKFINEQASFFAIITNDAWWFDSPGYRQHFSYARLRAIETRRYVTRSANTGISGIINSKGEVLAGTEFYTRTAVKASIPLLNKWTYYAKNGDYLGRLSVFMSSLILLAWLSLSLRTLKRKAE
jgi:apolipoprotein N-acyltransferase